MRSRSEGWGVWWGLYDGVVGGIDSQCRVYAIKREHEELLISVA